jgi:hypothetical protein
MYRRPRTQPEVTVVNRRGERVSRPRTADATQAPESRQTIQDEAAFRRLSRREQIEAAITAHVEHVRKQNDPDVLRKLSETEFWRFSLEQALRSGQLIDNGSEDPRIVLRASNLRELRSAWAAVKHLAPSVAKAETRPKMPNRDPWWTFIKDLRRGYRGDS